MFDLEGLRKTTISRDDCTAYGDIRRGLDRKNERLVYDALKTLRARSAGMASWADIRSKDSADLPCVAPKARNQAPPPSRHMQ
jgi:hypothetical protein